LAIAGGCRYGAVMIQVRRCFLSAVALSAAALTALPPGYAARQKKPTAAPLPTASVTQTLGTAGAWAAYASHDSTGRVCYLVGRPTKSEPAGLARKPPMAMVTHRPVEKIANVVSFVEGYPLKEGGEVALDVGGSKFELFTKDDSAWARTAELDKSIVATLAKGKQAVVKGQPQKGSPTTDVYALAGFAKALALIDKACGIKREDGAPPAPRAPHKRAANHR
jgi:invasion associated locus B (IalB) protein